MLINYVLSQTSFQKTYGTSGNEMSDCIHQTSDLGYFMTGLSDDGMVYAIKTNENGDTLWTKKILGYHATSSLQTIDGGYIIASYFSDQNLSCNDFKLTKLNPQGIISWSQQYISSQDVMNISVIQTNDNGFIVSGTTDSIAYSSTQNYDFMAVKTDENGVFEWSKIYGKSSYSSDEEINQIIQTSDFGYALIGSINNETTDDWDIYFIKTNSNGDVLWSKSYGGSYGEIGNGIVELSDGNFMIIGTTLSFDNGNQDVYVTKIDELGNEIWSKTIGGTMPENGFKIVEANDGIVLMGLTTSFGSGNADVYLVKLSDSGELLWSKTYGGNDEDRAFGFDINQDGGFIISGYSKSFGDGSYDYYLIKTDLNGNSLCNETSPNSTLSSIDFNVVNISTQIRTWGGLGSIPFSFPLTNLGVVITTPCTNASINNSTNSNQTIKIFPNPNNGLFTISSFTNERIIISDVLGKEVYNFIPNQNLTEIQIKTKGMYFVNIIEDKTNNISRLIIE